jgi:predicted AAA+ superfamily ATPase
MKRLVNLPWIQQIETQLESNSGLIQVILGPRQVGKTTSILHFLEQHHPNAHLYLSADKVFHATPGWIRENWQTAKKSGAVLVIDEIQKIENWAEAIKTLWDEDQRSKSKRVRCILLGSSSLEIQKGLTESLTGRFLLTQAHHWNFSESREGYELNFEDFLRYGGYPGSYPLLKHKRTWSEYLRHSIIETVIEKDILQNQTVKSPALFKQAFDLLMSHPAQEISYTKLLGQLQDKGNTELVKHYIRLYEGAFLLKAIQKYSTNPIQKKSSSPKILPLAPAMYYLNVMEDYSPEDRGRVFELLVGAQLVRTGLDLYYWREKNQEVDFVLKSGRRIYAIEVKSGRKKSTLGLQAFQASFPRSIPVILHPGNYPDFEKSPLDFLESLA